MRRKGSRLLIIEIGSWRNSWNEEISVKLDCVIKILFKENETGRERGRRRQKWKEEAKREEIEGKEGRKWRLEVLTAFQSWAVQTADLPNLILKFRTFFFSFFFCIFLFQKLCHSTFYFCNLIIKIFFTCLIGKKNRKIRKWIIY